MRNQAEQLGHWKQTPWPSAAAGSGIGAATGGGSESAATASVSRSGAAVGGKIGLFRGPAIRGSIRTADPLGTRIASPPNADRRVGYPAG